MDGDYKCVVVSDPIPMGYDMDHVQLTISQFLSKTWVKLHHSPTSVSVSAKIVSAILAVIMISVMIM